MKPILINIREMTDSKEVYDSKPGLFFSIFLYAILGSFFIALIWMCIGRIDIVVKSGGLIRPNDQVSTVINLRAGNIETVNVQDGGAVSEGDILYTIEHKDLLSQKNYIEDKLELVELDIDLMEKYLESITNHVNLFKNEGDEGKYYTKVESYFIQYNQIMKECIYQNDNRTYHLLLLDDKIEETNKKIVMLKKLKSSVMQQKNLFGNSVEEEEYQNLYLQYMNSYQKLTQQYDKNQQNIDLSTDHMKLTQSKAYYKQVLEGIKTLKDSINKRKDLFSESSIYQKQFTIFIQKLSELESNHQKLKDDYEVSKALEGLTVSEWEVEQAKIKMDEALAAISTYEISYIESLDNKIIETEKSIEELDVAEDGLLSKDDQIQNNMQERELSIDGFRLNYIVELEQKIAGNEEALVEYQSSKKELELQKEKEVVDKEDGAFGDVKKIKTNELIATQDILDSYRSSQEELKEKLYQVDQSINEAIVTAKMDGVVNSNVELVQGDVLSSGVQVMTLIPKNESQYKVYIYVSNQDIGKLEVGMKAKFDIKSYPSAEYGYFYGEITKISKDVKSSGEQNMNYYLVEATLDHSKHFIDGKEEVQIKPGMECSAKIITGNKRIITYVLEKINILLQ